MRSAQAVLALLLLFHCAAAAGEKKGWSVRKQEPPAPAVSAMDDSTYARLSAMPIDSLTARQFELLMQERQLRAQQQNSRRTTAITIGAVVVGIFVIAVLWAASRDADRAAARAASGGR